MSTSLAVTRPAQLPAPAEPPRLAERCGRAVSGYRSLAGPIGGGLKRGLDLVVASLALLALAPLLAAIAAAVKLDSPGPLLFRQRRAGYRGRVFRIYKFRTMTTLEDGRDFRQAARDDARVTRVGRLLRRTSLDELPQLINVLRGEMSLVGPRPHALLQEQTFRLQNQSYALRRMAKPGITGLAQVSGARGAADSPQKLARRLEFDLHYIRNWSLWLDLKILLRTAVLLARDPAAF